MPPTKLTTKADPKQKRLDHMLKPSPRSKPAEKGRLVTSEKENNTPLKKDGGAVKDIDIPVDFDVFVMYTNIREIAINEIKYQKPHSFEKYLRKDKYILQIAHKFYVDYYKTAACRKKKPLKYLQFDDDCPAEVHATLISLPNSAVKKLSKRKSNESIRKDSTAPASKPDSSPQASSETHLISKEKFMESVNLVENVCLPALHVVYPISFTMFKNYARYDETIDDIIECYSKDTTQISSLKADAATRHRILQNYYHAFYARPSVRVYFHLRLKPLPARIKQQIYAQPENVVGEDGTRTDNLRVETPPQFPLDLEQEHPEEAGAELEIPHQSQIIGLNEPSHCTEVVSLSEAINLPQDTASSLQRASEEHLHNQTLEDCDVEMEADSWQTEHVEHAQPIEAVSPNKNSLYSHLPGVTAVTEYSENSHAHMELDSEMPAAEFISRQNIQTDSSCVASKHRLPQKRTINDNDLQESRSSADSRSKLHKPVVETAVDNAREVIHQEADRVLNRSQHPHCCDSQLDTINAQLSMLTSKILDIEKTVTDFIKAKTANRECNRRTQINNNNNNGEWEQQVQNTQIPQKPEASKITAALSGNLNYIGGDATVDGGVGGDDVDDGLTQATFENAPAEEVHCVSLIDFIKAKELEESAAPGEISESPRLFKEPQTLRVYSARKNKGKAGSSSNKIANNSKGVASSPATSAPVQAQDEAAKRQLPSTPSSVKAKDSSNRTANKSKGVASSPATSAPVQAQDEAAKRQQPTTASSRKAKDPSSRIANNSKGVASSPATSAPVQAQDEAAKRQLPSTASSRKAKEEVSLVPVDHHISTSVNNSVAVVGTAAGASQQLDRIEQELSSLCGTPSPTEKGTAPHVNEQFLPYQCVLQQLTGGSQANISTFIQQTPSGDANNFAECGYLYGSAVCGTAETFINLPNTQMQISLLPPEQLLDGIDPLAKSATANDRDVGMAANGDHDENGAHATVIKLEKSEKSPLRNLKFVLDDQKDAFTCEPIPESEQIIFVPDDSDQINLTAELMRMSSETNNL